MTLPTVVAFVAFHAGPANNFAEFATRLAQDGYEIRVYASEIAAKKFQQRNIPIAFPFTIDRLSPSAEADLATQIADRCSRAAVVITDVGHPLDTAVHKQLAERAPQVLRRVYYDNAEPYVSGGYSQTAAKVMSVAPKVLFANANLVNEPLRSEPNQEIPLPVENRVGLGYFPMDEVKAMATRREKEQATLRARFFSQHGIPDEGQKIMALFGGNNEVFFDKDLPAFLRFLEEASAMCDSSRQIILFQQHPGAKSKNRDGQEIDKWKEKNRENANLPKWINSDWNIEDVQALTDVGIYCQTSTSPRMYLAGIPLIRVGDQPYEDVLVKNHLIPSATSTPEWIKAISECSSHQDVKIQREQVLRALGANPDWFQILKQTLVAPTENCSQRSFLATLAKLPKCLSFRPFSAVVDSVVKIFSMIIPKTE